MSEQYNNKSLFSDCFLDERVGGDTHWRSLKKEVWEYRQRIVSILEKDLPGINSHTPEAEVERRLIRPILDSLGHIYSVQPAVPCPEGVKRPDYAFFSSVEARQEAESHRGQSEFFKTALAVGDAKAWERSLDKRFKGPGDPFTNHNPSYQIDFYLRATDRRWGVLTNGRHWRLYHRDLSYRLDVFYEVDLPQVVTLNDDEFLYFLAFFHREAFEYDRTGECFLDRAYRSSTEYAAKVSEELKENVYEALRFLAEGFLTFPANSLKAQDLDLIRENAFVLIYRLLFVLYAEAREFLPVTNPTYWDTYSLRALTHEIANKEPFQANLHPTATGYWSRLQELFRLINKGDDFLGVPPYNGRLFDDQKEHQCLAAWKIGDRCLAEAVDQLARAEAAGRTGRGFVSYRDLSIRELGSIYEGLLEHRPRYAAQDVAVIREGKRERFTTLDQLGGRKPLRQYSAGSVYLETDKGERKVTGSYYTPDYIVRYIVSNTLGPLLEEARELDSSLIDSILSLKVLDPAMGSGHFLVEATDYLARALVEALGGDQREMEEDEIRWARREVVERCIYGVDLNPLAVDLAKLSLWLSTVSLDKPLNFLDHHLRCGNSLIGARLEDMGALPGKALKMKTIGKRAPEARPFTMWEDWFTQNAATAVDNYFRIAAISSDKLQDIQDKERLYAIARDILRRYYQVAHIWTSTYFGNEVAPQDYDNLLSSIRATEAEWAQLEKQPWFEKGVKIGEERRFFHWELEFPEAFLDRNGRRLPNPGFGAVVGNPPYVEVEKLDSEIRSYILRRWRLSAYGRSDLYVAFLELALVVRGEPGRASFIVPDKILTTDYGELYRVETLTHALLQRVLDVRYRNVFEDAANNPVVLVHCGPQATQATMLAIEELDSLDHARCRREIPHTLLLRIPHKRIRLDADQSTIELNLRLAERATPLERIAYISYGAQPGSLQRFVRWEPARPEGTHWKPFIKGENVERYTIEHTKGWLNYLPDELHRPAFPELFEQPKLVFSEIGANLQGAYDDSGYYGNEKVVFVLNCNLLRNVPGPTLSRRGVRLHDFDLEAAEGIPPLALLAILNSRLASFIFQSYISDGLNVYPDDLRQFPIPRESLIGQPSGGSLSSLAEDMTRFHKEKQSETKGFITWLEGYLGVSVEDLRNKTRVKDYWKAEVGWESFCGALQQNRRAIQSVKSIDVMHREPRETIRKELDISVTKLRPLLERIELTDKLIDQIVYRLYGLSDAEIAIVEGQPSHSRLA